MLQQGVELVLAFHVELGDPARAHGTHHATQLAEQLGIPVRVITGDAPAPD
jgi:trimethylamine:corrinoid methyltransferase-like protein